MDNAAQQQMFSMFQQMMTTFQQQQNEQMANVANVVQQLKQQGEQNREIITVVQQQTQQLGQVLNRVVEQQDTMVNTVVSIQSRIGEIERSSALMVVAPRQPIGQEPIAQPPIIQPPIVQPRQPAQPIVGIRQPIAQPPIIQPPIVQPRQPAQPIVGIRQPIVLAPIAQPPIVQPRQPAQPAQPQPTAQPLTLNVLGPEKRDGFSLWSEGKFREQNPEEYQRLIADRSFDPRYFTTTTDFRPIYAKNMSPHAFGRLNGMFNQTIWNDVAAGSRDYYRKQTARMLAVNDPNYRPRTVDPIKMINTGHGVETDPTLILAPLHQEKLANVIRRFGVANVPFNPNGRLGPTSLTQPAIVRQFNGAVEGIGNISERAYFNGLITRTRYEVRPELQDSITLELFTDLLRRSIIQRLSTDMVNPGPTPYYNVFIYFNGPPDTVDANIPSIRTPAYNALGADDLARLRVGSTDFAVYISEEYGSDTKVENYTLDPTRFEIEKIDVTRSGAGSVSNHNYKKKDYPWGRVREYNSKNSGCFAKILAEVIKALSVVGPKDKPWRYDALWRYLDDQLNTTTVGLPVTPEWCDLAARLFGLCLIVSNELGEITFNASQFGVSCVPENTLRVMLENDHYSHIVHWAPTLMIKRPRNKIKRYARLPPVRQHVSVYYDLETVNTVEPGAEVHVIPYANAWGIEDDEVEVVTTANPDPYYVLEQMLTSIVNHFNQKEWPIGGGKLTPVYGLPTTPFPGTAPVAKVQTLGPPNTHIFYRLIAYNGSKFDHAILFLYLVSNGWHIVQAPSATGKLRSMCFYLGKRLLNEDENGVRQYAKAFIEIWDPCLYTCASLSKVSKDFGLSLSKGELPHAEVQAAYANGRLGDWLNQNHRAIVDYNKLDVEVLRELVKRMVSALGPEIFEHNTIAGMCYKTWRDSSFNPKRSGSDASVSALQMKDVALAVETPELDTIVRSGIIGGRVEGVVGDHTEEFAMLDVVSLYPFVMQTYTYPIGRETVLYDPTVTVECLSNPLVIGLYCVEVDQAPMRTQHPILPVRLGTLDWSWEGVRNAGRQHLLLPDVTIRDLQNAGAIVNLSTSLTYQGRVFYGITWTRSSPGALFNDYIAKFSAIKKEEDRKKAQGLPFNAALREMSKLMLNSLSGKMAQRNFRKQSKFWTSENSLRSFITDNHEKRPTPYIVGKNAAFTVTNRSVEEAYRNPHPSHIGVFIYAYARSYMWTLFFSKMKVLYSDTDSALIRVRDLQLIPKALIVQNTRGILHKEFGMLDIENTPSRALIIAPKTYTLLNRDNTVIKARTKGVRDSDYWLANGDNGVPTKIAINSDYLRFFTHLLLHQEAKVCTWTFRNVVREGRLERRDLIKILRPSAPVIQNEDADGAVTIL